MTWCWSAAAARDCAPPLPSPRPIPASTSPSCPRCTRCAATPSPPRAARRASIAPDDSLDEHAYDTISGRRLAVRPGCRRGVRQGSARGAASPRALGLSVEPRGRRTHCRSPLRRHEEDAHVVCRRQDRLPHAPHALPDLPQVPSVVRYDEWFVTRLLVDDGRVQGVVAIDLKSGQSRGDHRARRHPLHRRLRQGVPVHDQRRHQERRRHGARLPRRRAAQGHGVRPVPPDRAFRSPAS